MNRSAAQRARDSRARRRALNPPLRRPGENVDRAGRPWKLLTDDQVHEIRRRLVAPDPPTQAALAREYGIDPSTVSQIATGRRRRRCAAVDALKTTHYHAPDQHKQADRR